MRALTLFSIFAASTAALAAYAPLGPIKNPHFEPCMCELYLNEAKDVAVLLSDPAGKVAVLNIEGNDTKLRLETTDNQSEYWVGGLTYKRTYLHGTAKVTVLMTAEAFQGGEGGGSLEGNPMKAVITYSLGNKNQSIHATGSCGCESHSNNVFQPTNSRCARIRG